MWSFTSFFLAGNALEYLILPSSFSFCKTAVMPWKDVFFSAPCPTGWHQGKSRLHKHAGHGIHSWKKATPTWCPQRTSHLNECTWHVTEGHKDQKDLNDFCTCSMYFHVLFHFICTIKKKKQTTENTQRFARDLARSAGSRSSRRPQETPKAQGTKHGPRKHQLFLGCGDFNSRVDVTMVRCQMSIQYGKIKWLNRPTDYPLVNVYITMENHHF